MPQDAVRGWRQLPATCRESREWEVGSEWGSLFPFPFLKESLERIPRQLAASCRELIPSKGVTMLDVSAGLGLRVDLKMTRGKLPQVAASCRVRPVAACYRKLPQVAVGQLTASCRKLLRLSGRQVAASYHNLPQVAAGPSCA